MVARILDTWHEDAVGPGLQKGVGPQNGLAEAPFQVPDLPPVDVGPGVDHQDTPVPDYLRPAVESFSKIGVGLALQPYRLPDTRLATEEKALRSVASSRGSSSKLSSTRRRAFSINWSVSQGFLGSREPCR
jgi:hypothetical protein